MKKALPLRATLTLSVPAASALRQLTSQRPTVVLEQLTLDAVPVGVKVHSPPTSFLAIGNGPSRKKEDSKVEVRPKLKITDMSEWRAGTFYVPKTLVTHPAIAATPTGIFRVSTEAPLVIKDITGPSRTQPKTAPSSSKSVWDLPKIPKKSQTRKAPSTLAKNSQPNYAQLKLCFNCHRPLHHYNAYPRHPKVFCRKCGFRDVTLADCPRCRIQWRARGPFVRRLQKNVPWSQTLDGRPIRESAAERLKERILKEC